MAIRALTLGLTKDWVSPNDSEKGTPKETVFTIGSLDVLLAAHISDASMVFRDGGTVVNAGSAAVQRVRFGLKGVKNFTDAHGKIVKIEFEETQVDGSVYQVVTMDFIRRLPLHVIRELGNEINEFNGVTPDEAKNSVVA